MNTTPKLKLLPTARETEKLERTVEALLLFVEAMNSRATAPPLVDPNNDEGAIRWRLGLAAHADAHRLIARLHALRWNMWA